MKRKYFLWITILFVLFHPPLSAAHAPYSRRNAVVEAVEKSSAAVVNVSSEQIHETRATPFNFGASSPFFDDFFRDFYESLGPREYKTQSLGSGVIISSKGYILTNEHVVDRATAIRVRLADKTEYRATLVGSDPKSDIAVLRIKADKPLPYIHMGRSDDLMIGETVIAIGNPFGLSHSVTTGVISALNRSIRTKNRLYQDFIQTDASINPGNSGGPLLNINGQLIGINTAIYRKAEGIGFAIPIGRARRIYEDLLAFGRVHKPWLGIFLQDLTPQLVRYFNLPEGKGILISRVIRNSPADRAGLREGDILIRIGDHEVEDRESYLTLIEGYRVNDKIPLRYLRNGKMKRATVKGSSVTPERALSISREWLGLDVAEGAEGVVLKKVGRHSEAYRIGLRPGDLIRQVNSIPVSSLKDYQEAMEQVLNAENVVLMVVRDGVGYSVTLSP
ncbi:MAG: Do family serine endopeptidase [Deltaproteobacteria bacterium]|nr:Do family serine endopeptidase [Deltaproteobacteria bacterium]